VRLTVIVESGHKVEQAARLESDLIAKDLFAAVRMLTGK
jgi:hypothetical protein